jgi:hypothetical protein
MTAPSLAVDTAAQREQAELAEIRRAIRERNFAPHVRRALLLALAGHTYERAAREAGPNYRGTPLDYGNVAKAAASIPGFREAHARAACRMRGGIDWRVRAWRERLAADRAQQQAQR